MTTNKFGVPYHQFNLILDDGKTQSMDIGYQEDWGEVSDFIDQTGHKGIGWGNDEDGYDEIHQVIDLETKETLDPSVWFEKWIVPQVNKYSE